jgi:hypothetical protein
MIWPEERLYRICPCFILCASTSYELHRLVHNISLEFICQLQSKAKVH